MDAALHPLRLIPVSSPGPAPLLLVPGGLALVSGLDAGLTLAGVPAPVGSTRLAALHGPLMVLGFLGTVISLLLALEWGGSRYSWSSGQVVAPLVVFAVTLVAWLVLQYFQVRTRWHTTPNVPR